jgi:hypothetical protein
MRMPLDGGGELQVEVADDQPGIQRATRIGDTIEAASTSLTAVLEPIREAAVAARRAFQQAAADEIEVEFGVKLTAEAGAILAKSSAEGHLQVRLLWRNERNET